MSCPVAVTLFVIKWSAWRTATREGHDLAPLPARQPKLWLSSPL